MNKVPLYIFIFLIFCTPKVSEAQTTKLGREVKAISDYIASKDFVELRKRTDDAGQIDSIFSHSLKISRGDYSEALFALTFAAVPYKKIPVEIPLTGIVVDYPLVSAGDSVFKLKNRNLPRYLYFDSPSDNFGDKDKIAHFFGSAFLSYSSNFFDLGDLIGYFVEVFEQNFKVQSSIDFRDIQSDTLGNIFGLLLKKNKNTLPSSVMMIRSLFYIRYHL